MSPAVIDPAPSNHQRYYRLALPKLLTEFFEGLTSAFTFFALFPPELRITG